MTDEAEKVINLSLCKMASSRAFKKGGSTLHKHLLIASVLTKARSAYFENWYLGSDCSSPLNSTSSTTAAGPSGIVPLCEQTSTTGSSASVGDSDDEVSMNNNHIIDPRLFVEVESEMELPSDILNCVEKLSSIGDIDFIHNNNQSASEEEIVRISDDPPTPEMILSDVMVDIDEVDVDKDQASSSSISSLPFSSESMKLTYLDLDARPPTPNKSLLNSSDNSHRSYYSSSSNGLLPIVSSSIPAATANNNIVIEPIILSEKSDHRTNFKRRRGWSEDEELHTEIDIEDEEEEDLTQTLPNDLNEKLKKNGVSVTNMAKRLRFSSSRNNSTTITDPNEQQTTCFRIKKAQFEVDDDPDKQYNICSSASEEDEDDSDSFLVENLDQTLQTTSWCDANKNDRRVPSNSASSSSNSSSDEENDHSDSMEVDQITSLVQYFSFSQQKTLKQLTASSTSSPLSSATGSSGLIRSISSPDLCNNRCVIVTT